MSYDKIKNIIFGMLVGIIMPSMIFKFNLYIFVGALLGGLISAIIVRRRDKNIKYVFEKRRMF